MAHAHDHAHSHHGHGHGHGHPHAHGHDHSHGHGPALGDRRERGREGERAAAAGHQRRLLFVLFLGLTLLVAEVVAGLAANSLVLLSDAAHVSTDVAAVALAYAAIRLSARPPTSSKTYGYYRAETVAAFVNALVLWVISGYFVWEAWQRLSDPPAVQGLLVAIVGGASLALNLLMAFVLHAGSRESLNVRSAYLHVLSDALGSLAALAAGLGVMFYDARWLDPALTLVVALLLVVWTYRLTRDTLHILLEGTPSRVDVGEVRATILGVPGVLAVHDLHLWSLTTGVDNLSAHVQVANASDGFAIVSQLRRRLRDEHHLSHVTIEVETEDSENCMRCD